jgi:glutamate racemase
LGIIRPSVEALAGLAPGSGVALWATSGTVQSRSYEIELQKSRPDLRLVSIACPLLVPLVENGELDGPALAHFLERYWRQVLDAGLPIEALLLGCTHYPLLAPAIRRVIPASVRLVEQGAIVAPSLADYLGRHPEMEQRLSHGASARFLTTDVSADFDRLATLFLGHAVRSERVDLEAPPSGGQAPHRAS